MRELCLGVGKFTAPLAAKGIQLLCNHLTAQACGLGAPSLPAAGERHGCADQIAGEGCFAIEGLVEATALQAGCPLAALEFPIRFGHLRTLFHGAQERIVAPPRIGCPRGVQQFFRKRYGTV